MLNLRVLKYLVISSKKKITSKGIYKFELCHEGYVSKYFKIDAKNIPKKKIAHRLKAEISLFKYNEENQFDFLKKEPVSIAYYDYTKKFWITEIKDNQLIYNWDLLYNKDHYIHVYEKRNKEIEDYFQKKKEDLLIFNVSENTDILKILNFIKMKKHLNFDVPHELKSNYDNFL